MKMVVWHETVFGLSAHKSKGCNICAYFPEFKNVSFEVV